MADDVTYNLTYDTGSMLAGLGMPVGLKPTRVAPTREVMAGGHSAFSLTYPQMLSNSADDLAREVGPNFYDAMLTDPAVASAVGTLILAIIADGPQVQPNIKATPGKDEDPKQRRSREMAEFGQRYLSRPSVDILGGSVDLLMGFCYGARLAEQTLAECTVGDDAGLLVLDRLKGKPRRAWNFIVDPTWEVIGIAGLKAGTQERIFLPREKFAILSWMPREGDPRGISGLRAAFNAWNLKTQSYPQYFQHLRQFAGDSVVGEVAEGAVPTPDPTTGMMIEPTESMLRQLLSWQAGSAMAHGHGAKVYTVGGTGDGSVFTKAIETFNQEITQAILYQTRATKEAQHGSKADSEGGADIFGLLVRYGRNLLGGVFRRDIIRHGIEVNFGAADADEFCPTVSFGCTEHQDKAPLMLAVAKLWQSKFLDESQVPELCTTMGIPVPSMEALQMRLDREKAATELAINPPPPVIAPGLAPGTNPKPKKAVPA